MDPLAVLVRLAGLEVERERQALAELDATLEPLRDQIAQARAEAERERRAATDLAGARLLAIYLEGSRRRLRSAEAEVARLEQARARQLARLIEHRLERKRLELLQARNVQRRQIEAARREQRNADELAVIAAARRR